MNSYSKTISAFSMEVESAHYLDNANDLHSRLLTLLNCSIDAGSVHAGWIDRDEFYYHRVWRIYLCESRHETHYAEHKFEQKLGVSEC